MFILLLSDNDECSGDVMLCNDITSSCVNTPGSYECACKEGFQKIGDSCTGKVPYLIYLHIYMFIF